LKSIMFRLTVALVMVAMVLVSAVPALADKGQQGHISPNTTSGDCQTGCTFTNSTSGRHGNLAGGPGHSSLTGSENLNGCASGDPNQTCENATQTSSGGTGNGGGRSTTNLNQSGAPPPKDITCTTTNKGSQPPPSSFTSCGF
jgi:hypothetical protein